MFRRIAITAITLLPLGAVAAPLPPTNSGGAPTLIVPPINAPSPAQVTDVRSSKGKTTRIVVDLSAPVDYEVMRYPGRITVRLPGTTTQPRYQSFGTDAVARMRLVTQDADTVIEVEVASRADVDVFPLHDPDRVVIDATLRDDPPPSPGPPTSGVTYERLLVPANGSGNKPLHLVKLDPSRYAPRVITAGWGATRNVLDLAASEGAAAAINGGYFDPASSLAVDLVLSSSGVLAYALGNRPALLLSGPQAAFGTPRGRLVVRLDNLDGTTTTVNVSTVNPNPRPGWVTAFIGDGFVPNGAAGFTTLTIADGLVSGRHEEPFTPDKGVLTVSFQPSASPQLDLLVGAPASLDLAWTDPSWDALTGAVAGGPTLIRNGAYAIDAKSEGFDTNSSLWRPTRQSALGLMTDGTYVLAMLEYGGPEDMARAMLQAGVREAIRLDSGTSSSLYLNGGMVAGVWGRSVPNAIAFVPR